jgi:hypothetical protein
LSSGPGHIKQAIAALIAAQPSGAWTTTELAQRAYRIHVVERRHKLAVALAIRTMALPAGWRVAQTARQGGENVFFNAGSDESIARAAYLQCTRGPASESRPHAACWPHPGRNP